MTQEIEINVTEQVVEVDIINEIIQIEAPAGSYSISSGLPQGGVAGQILAKKNEADFQAEWVTPTPTNYIHLQDVPSDTWVIEHNLGKYPSVNIVDSANDDVIGEINYNNINQITLTFTASFSGKAFLN